ncbi:hypothetical protein [Spiroplasma endosymbiont of Eupeodes luniger]|uniref:hypothetical protein n=1 Tax=Spiroplasma endosymbiont of Eupeodes luniger TaxID=3066300 RepID=UPI0030D2FFA8
MAERKSIFSQSKIGTISKDVSQTLLNKSELINTENKITSSLKLIKGGKKQHVNLTLLPEKYQKVKQIALENKLSISALFEQLIDQL